MSPYSSPRKTTYFHPLFRLLISVSIIVGLLANNLLLIDAANIVLYTNIQPNHHSLRTTSFKHAQAISNNNPIPPFKKEEIEPPSDISVPEPTIWNAPGSLSLETSHYLLRAGEPFTLTVRVLQEPSQDIIGDAVQINLPSALRVVSGETSWIVDKVRSDGISERTLILQAKDIQPNSTFKIEAILSREGYKDQRRNLLLGTVLPPKSISVLLDPLDQNIAITIRPLGNVGESSNLAELNLLVT